MLPYYPIIPFVVKLPGLTIVGGVFQTLIALGFVIALCKIVTRSQRVGLNWEFTVSLAAVVGAVGYIGSHILWVIFYSHHILFQPNRWEELANIGGSISSVGGFISGALTFLCARLLLGRERPWLQIADLFLQASEDIIRVINGRRIQSRADLAAVIAAEISNRSEKTIELWKRLFNKRGIDGLTIRSGRGRSRRISSEQFEAEIAPVFLDPASVGESH